jgi:Ca2+-binding RTX toxin-like protein
MRRPAALPVRFVPLLISLLVSFVIAPSAGGQPRRSSGPIILLGIDAEDGGPGGHGPTDVYASVLKSGLIANAANGSGMLVVGGNKDPTDDVTEWWNEVAFKAGVAVTYANGASIGTVDFTPFKIIAIASDENQSPGGGLTMQENTDLAARGSDLRAHLSVDGGLFGMANTFTGGSGPYAYLAPLGTFTVTTTVYDDITATPEGAALSIGDELDVCCWHNTFTTYPSVLSSLATNSDPSTTEHGQAAGVGGEIIVPGPKAGPITTCRGKPATIEGGVGNDALAGTPGDDVIAGLAGNDVISGVEGDDLVCGGEGDDTVNGGRGRDRLFGESGNDRLIGAAGEDRLSCGPGRDKGVGGRGRDRAPGCETARGVP